MNIHYDPTISLGNIVTLITVIYPLYKVVRHLSRMEQRFNLVWNWFSKNVIKVDDVIQ